MRLLFPALVLALLATTRAAEDSCVGRCDDGFDAQHKCQCDTLCVYYQSCCSDYSTVCKAKVTRGDVFALPEDDYLDYNLTVDFSTVEGTEAAPTELPTSLLPAQPTWETKPSPEETLMEVPVEEVPSTALDGFGAQDPMEEPEELCSRKPFDAFTDLKNGSLYAFRGKYFYELDETSVRPGYPKLISDIWGIEGPIDAAFTRINCQGKTYLFKVGRSLPAGLGVLPGRPARLPNPPWHPPPTMHAVAARYPQIPAALCLARVPVTHPIQAGTLWSIPPGLGAGAGGCLWGWALLTPIHHCPSNSSSASLPAGASSPRYISKDWRGVPSRLDAAMAGRIYVASQRPRRRKSRRQRKRYKSHRSLNLGFWSWLQNDSDSAGIESDWLSGSQCETLQSVYFFVGDKYYRVNLRTKRVDLVQPRYPRSIAQYWLDCPQPGEKTT
ncbi:Vitronectin [Aptenodytes forsteri]|uniref:Vitronectin n=1 Tax=Aptenodytes forsteri TaxID=9233 RepID=A0A087QZU5_APTFO|nr:Vitronectin [Aptenodytes forsteri]